METARVRVGLAGAGWVSGHHLQAWSALGDRAAVVAIADPDLTAAEARAADFAIPAVYRNVEEMVGGVPLDALDIAAPREHHVPICRFAARHGLAVLCQKPLAPTLDEAESLVADVGGRIRLMVHENWRFRPHYRRIHAWLRAGRIGAVRTATMSVLTSGLLPDPNADLPALVRQPMLARLDRMLLMEVLIHHVDTMRFLLGPLTLDAARLGRSCDAIRGEDRAALMLTAGALPDAVPVHDRSTYLLRRGGSTADDAPLFVADGAAVSIIGDFMAHGRPPQQMDRLEIYGTDGAILLRGDRLRLVGPSEQSLALDLAADYQASYRGAIAHFLDRLADGAPFETGPDDNLKTLAIVEQAYRIAEWNSGRTHPP